VSKNNVLDFKVLSSILKLKRSRERVQALGAGLAALNSKVEGINSTLAANTENQKEINKDLAANIDRWRRSNGKQAPRRAVLSLVKKPEV
jgi:hypothetical protein